MDRTCTDEDYQEFLRSCPELLSRVPYEDLTPEPIALPPRQIKTGYVRPPMTDQTFIPEVY